MVLCFYAWTVWSAGGFKLGASDYYRFLVDGYLQGSTSLSVKPLPEMLALSDPYDPRQNGPFRVADASYYQGKYYLYFGPTPAVLLLVPYRLLTGSSMPGGVAIFLFVSAGFILATCFCLELRRRYFPASGWLTPAIGVLVLGFCTHVLALGRRPMFWELPIAVAFALTMLALCAVQRAGNSEGRRRLLFMALAGLSLGLAFAARPPYLFATALVLPSLLLLWSRSRSEAAASGGIFAAMFCLCCVGVAAYNFARFGSPMEFGQRYQLSGVYESAMRHFSPSYVLHNVWIYYVSPFRWTWDFPWVSLRPPGPGPEGYYAGEEVSGILATFPVLTLALVALGLACVPQRGRAAGLLCELRTVALLFAGMGGFLLMFFSSTERYMADFTPAVAILAWAGWLVLERSIQAGRLWTRLLMPSVALLALASAGMGVLVSLDYHDRELGRLNPACWRAIEARPGRLFEKLREMLGLPARPIALHLELAHPSSGQAGGVLGLRLTLPTKATATKEPLLALGVRGAADMLGVERQADGRWVFVFDHWGAPLLRGPEIALAADELHHVQIEMPNLQVDRHGQAAHGQITVRVNGQIVLRGTSNFAPFLQNQLRIGMNSLGGTTFDRVFSGSIKSAGWEKSE